jgi:hypothetical protein
MSSCCAALGVLRQFRCKVVQTASQYVFIHQVLIDVIAQKVACHCRCVQSFTLLLGENEPGKDASCALSL